MSATALVRFQDLEPVPGKCNAKARHGGLCGKPAGWGVEGEATGRCRLHRGRPIKHGLYSELAKTSDRIAALLERHLENPDPLDTTPEIALVRALLQDWVERYSTIMPALLAWHLSRDNPKPATVPDVTEAVRLISEISKAAKRERDTQNANWISRKDLARLMAEVLDVIQLHVPTEVDDGEPVACGCCGAHYRPIRRAIGKLAAKS